MFFFILSRYKIVGRVDTLAQRVCGLDTTGEPLASQHSLAKAFSYLQRDLDTKDVVDIPMDSRKRYHQALWALAHSCGEVATTYRLETEIIVIVDRYHQRS